jgi:hypothetical protein
VIALFQSLSSDGAPFSLKVALPDRSRPIEPGSYVVRLSPDKPQYLALDVVMAPPAPVENPLEPPAAFAVRSFRVLVDFTPEGIVYTMTTEVRQRVFFLVS